MASNNSDTFNQLTKGSSSYWKAYSRGRPSVPASFWKRLPDYHTQHGNGRFTTAHDLGSGPGIHAASLGSLFSHVTLTDPNPKNIEAAMDQIFHLPDAERYACRTGRGEDPVGPGEREKYDLVFLGNALHWMDPVLSMDNIAASLRPGGTFAAALFGLPDVTDENAQKVLGTWQEHGVDQIIEGGTSPLFGYSITSQDSGYDSVRVDPAVWENITRVRLNRGSSKRRNLTTKKVLETYGEGHSIVTEDESIITGEDHDWYVKTDLDGLREMLSSFPLPLKPEFEKSMWESLDQVYKSKPVEVHYGVNIVLATKK